jgi:hypothetical protein
VLENQRWTNNFNKEHFYTCNKKNMAEVVSGLYNNILNADVWYNYGVLKIYKDIESQVFHKWNSCFNDFKSKQSNNNTAKICSEQTVRLQDYIKGLERNIICIDDIRSVLTNKNKFRVIYTDDDTYLTKDPQFIPKEEEVTGVNLLNFA